MLPNSSFSGVGEKMQVLPHMFFVYDRGDRTARTGKRHSYRHEKNIEMPSL